VNPEAHNYCVQNIFLNKVHDRVTAILGDVKDVCPAYKEEFDRVLMPLPKGAMNYLDTAVPCLKENGILHFYHWADEGDLFSEAERLVKAAAERANREAEILNRVRVLPYGPRTWKVRVDVRTDTRL